MQNTQLFSDAELEKIVDDARVHRTKGRTAIAVQHLLEDCLEKVLEIEQWDRAPVTQKMQPATGVLEGV